MEQAINTEIKDTLMSNIITLHDEKKLVKNSDICFDINKLHDSTFKNLLLQFDNNSISPTEYLLTSLLAVLSGLVGRKAYFSFKDTLNIYLNVWAVIIGKSTVMHKTTALNETLYNVEKINSELTEQFKIEVEKYESLTENEKKESKKPTREYLRLPDDTTAEKLLNILSGQQRGIYKASEFAGFLKKLERSYAGDSKELLTDIFDVPQSITVSRQTRDDVTVERPCFSFIGASTIEWYREGIKKNDLQSGFLARYLYSIKEENTKQYIPFPLLKEQTKKYDNHFISEVYRNLYAMKEDKILNFEDSSVKVAINYEKKLYNDLKQCDDSESSFGGRLIVYFYKIVGLISLVNNHELITLEDVYDSMLISDYYKMNIQKLLVEKLTETQEQRNENRIYNKIKSSGKNGIAHSELMQKTGMERNEFKKIIDNLIGDEMIVTYSAKKDEDSQKSGKYYKTI